MYRVFLSHSRRDNTAAQGLFRWLTDNEPSLKGEVFLDINPDTGFAPGVRWKSELARAVDRCEAVICLISRHWENSAECLGEFRLAESLNKRIFCARIDPAANGDRVREWQICDLFPDGESPVTAISADNGQPVAFASDGLARLLRGLRDAGIGAEYFPWPPDDDPHRAPYRGWQSMEDIDAAVFFGRDPPILRGLDTLRGMRTTGVEGLFVILGPSGVGKSSFLRAGLLPRLRRDRTNFQVCDIVRPERAALTGEEGLAQAIWKMRTRAGPGAPALGDVKAACLHTDITRLTAWLGEAQRDPANDDAPPTLVLPIDQGEELFSADAGPEAATCLTLLGGLLQTPGLTELPLIAAMTIRADRYESLQNAPGLLGVHTREFGDLKPMPLTEYKDVITGPAVRATAAGQSLSVDAALVARLLADATGGADSLPLLALTLARLHLDYGSTGRLTLANYEAMGGMARIVEAEINTLLATDPDQRARQLDTLRRAFIPWLATIDPDTDTPSRRVARWDELPSGSHELIDAMVARRLLVKDERGGDTVVEVALESLLRQWDSLAQWLRDQAADLKAADSLDRAAADWERNGRNPEWLIEGVRLAAAQELAQSPVFGNRVRHAAEFLTASRDRQDAQANAELRTAQAHAAALRKRARVLRAVLAVTLAVAVIAVTTSVWAVLANRKAEAKRRDALAERLTAQAEAILAGGQPGTGLEAITKILAGQHLSATPDIGALLTALSTKPRLHKIMDLPRGGLLSADGERVATTTDSGIRLLDTETGQPVGQPFADPRTEHTVAISLDGRYVALAGQDHTIRIWDSTTSQPVGQPLTGSETSDEVVAVSPDGRRVAASDRDNTLRLWDTETGRQIGKPLSEGRFVTALAFSPHGHRLVTADDHQRDQVWDADSGAALGEPLRGEQLTGSLGGTRSIAFSPDGRTIAGGGDTVRVGSGSSGTPLELWNADTGDGTAAAVPGNSPIMGIDAIAFSADGLFVATGGTDKTVRLWDARTAQPIGPPLSLQAPVRQVAFTRHGNEIVAVSGDTVEILDADPGAGLAAETNGSKALELAERQRLNGSTGLETKSNRLILFVDNTFSRFDADTGNPVGPPVVSEALRGQHIFAVSTDGRWLAIPGPDNAATVLDTSSGRMYGQPLQGHTHAVNDLEFSPDGQLLATASADNTVRLWDWRHGRPIGEPLTGHQNGVEMVKFSDDGHRLYSRSAESIRVWDTATRKPVGKPIVTDNTVTDPFIAVAVSPNGRRIATVHRNTVQQWDADSGEVVGPAMAGHHEVVQTIAYSADGRYLVSASLDNTLRFWDSASGQQLGEPLDTTAVGYVHTVSFNRDGRRVFLGASRFTADWKEFVGGGVWQVPAPASWADALCDKLAADPAPKRWAEWISADIPYTAPCPGKRHAP